MNPFVLFSRAKLLAIGGALGVAALVSLALVHQHAKQSFSIAASYATRDSITRATVAIIAKTDTVIIERTVAYTAQKARVDSLEVAWQRNRDNGKMATELLETKIRAESAEAQRDSTVQAVNGAAQELLVKDSVLVQSVNQFAHEKDIERNRADSVIVVLQSERTDNAKARVLAEDALRVEQAKPKCGKLCTVKHVVVGSVLTVAAFELKQHLQVKK